MFTAATQIVRDIMQCARMHEFEPLVAVVTVIMMTMNLNMATKKYFIRSGFPDEKVKEILELLYLPP